MGLRLVTATPDRVVVELDVGPQHLQPFGLVHGGVHAGLVETVCSIGAQLAAPAGTHIVGVENHTSFLRPVKAGLLRTTGTPLHKGRRAQLWQAEIHDAQGRLVATGRLRVFALPSEATQPT
jgi:uncharacterized protein (TIGR00369 family)